MSVNWGAGILAACGYEVKSTITLITPTQGQHFLRLEAFLHTSRKAVQFSPQHEALSSLLFTAPRLPTLRLFAGKQAYTPRMRGSCTDLYRDVSCSCSIRSNQRKKEGGFASVSRLKAILPIARRVFYHSRHIHTLLRLSPRLAPRYIHLSSSDMTLKHQLAAARVPPPAPP